MRTEASEENPERRLHPWSWLFVLVQQLKQFIVPLAALLVFGGSGGPGGFWAGIGPLIAVGVLVVISVLQYFTYRYRIGRDGLSIRDGWLHRSLREIPYSRIHNVVLHQSVLHRLFGVAEVRLESAGGQKPEAQMRVLRLDQALALESLIKHRGQAPDADAPVVQADSLLSLPTAEVIRLGLVSNRGMIVMAAAFGAAWQVFPDRLVTDYFERFARQLFGYASHLHYGWITTAAAAAALLLLAALLLRLLSVLLALVQYHGFRLSEEQRRLTVERGLLSKLRTSVARRRIQAWTLHEGFLHRLLKRRSLRIDTAVAEQQGKNDQRALKELAPIATPEACDALIQRLLPQAHWPRSEWTPLPTAAWWRLFLPTLVFIGILVLVLVSNARDGVGTVAAAMAAVEHLCVDPASAARRLFGGRTIGGHTQRLVVASLALCGNRQTAGATPGAFAHGQTHGHRQPVDGHRWRQRLCAAAADSFSAGSRSQGALLAAVARFGAP